MGAINNAFLQNKISLSKIKEILENPISQSKYKSQNMQILQETGLFEEYSNILSDKYSKEIIYYSKENKIIKNYIKSSKIESNFAKWIKYLFDINEDDLNSEQILNKKKENLRNNPLNKMFLKNNLKKYILKDNSFNKLVNYGIPNNIRALVWDTVISEKYANHKFFNFEEEQKEYNLLLKNTLKNTQIEKDINRTFMKESEKTEKNLEKLRNILNCLNKYHNYGYFQGMNFIVGFLLKLTKFDEIKAFYILKNIFPNIKGYFEDGFPLLKENLNLFDKYFKELYPKLYKHFKKNEVFNELWVGKWFQTLFTLSLPFEELCYIWDILLIKGFDYIIYISLAIVETLEKNLLELNDSSDIYSYLQNVLNPKNTIGIYKNLFENIDDYIIPLNNILSKASVIEKKIKEDYGNISSNKVKSEKQLYNYSFNSNNLKKEFNNSSINESFETKERDGSIKKINSLTSKSLTSLNKYRSNILSGSNLSNAHGSFYNLKNNLSNIKVEQNNNNTKTNKKSTFYSSRNVLIDDNSRISNKRKTLKENENSFNKLRNFYNINNINIPSQQVQNFNNNINYNNMAYVSHQQYTNYLIFYG